MGVMETEISGFAVGDATITVNLQSNHFSDTNVTLFLVAVSFLYNAFALLIDYAHKSTHIPFEELQPLDGVTRALLFPLLLTNHRSDAVIYVATF